ncbi:MAG: hypothetical protein AB7S44_02755 [Spirochaetales bacterium]
MKKISPNTFEERVGYARHANSIIYHDEIAWFANDDYSIYGTIIRDKIDNDFSAVVLEKNKLNKYVATDQTTSLVSTEDAKKWLESKLNK